MVQASTTPEITSYEIRTVRIDTSDIGQEGGGREIVVSGQEGAQFDINVINEDTSYYNFDDNNFTSTKASTTRFVDNDGDGVNETLSIATIDSTGIYRVIVDIPEVSDDDEYTITIKTMPNTSLRDGVLSEYKIFQYLRKTLTFSATGSGLTVSGLSQVITNVAGRDYDGAPLNRIKLSGTVTKSGADYLYVSEAPAFSDDDNDWSNAQNISGQELVAHTSDYSKITVTPGSSAIATGMTITDIQGDIPSGLIITVSSVVSSTIFGLSFNLADSKPTAWAPGSTVLEFKPAGGYITDFFSATATGSGTATITVNATGEITSFGTSDVSSVLALGNFITATPNASDQTASCTAGATVAVDCGSGDTDANASSKTYSRVSGPSKGTVGNNSTAFNNNTFTGSTITYNNTSGSAGATDTFTFKQNDGTTDSATKTVTITLT